MNYKKVHDQIIDRAVLRGLNKKDIDYYTERHHIQPRSLGGSDQDDNLVLLSAREHFIIHWLLFKIYRNQSTAFAWNMMCMPMPTGKRQTSASYKYAREAFSAAQKGVPKADAHRAKISEALKA